MIKNRAAEMRAMGKSPFQTAKDLAMWMFDRVTFDTLEPQFSKTPPQVLDSGKGQCIELSLLYASLCRAAGITARIVWGDYLSKRETIGHIWAEFYDGRNWVPVDMTFMIKYHSGPMAQNFGPFSDWFGFADARNVNRWVEDPSESSIETLYNDTYQFNAGFGLSTNQTASGSMSIQMASRLLVYNTGRRELFIDIEIPT
ncbi:MAG: transglutaminase-like domain-containing protein [Candidatus Hadarchaeum sp.]